MATVGGLGLEGFGLNGLQALDFQQFCHAIDAARLARGLQLDGDSPRAVAPSVSPEDVVDEWHQFTVSFDLRGLDFAEPGVVARAADVEGVAHGSQSKSSWERELFDEGIRIG